jgi:hypothetical protein
MRLVKTVLPAALVLVPAAFLITGGLLAPTPGFGIPKYATDNHKPCTFCHQKMGDKDAMHKDPNLTDAGKYFKDHNHSLEGYKPPAK